MEAHSLNINPDTLKLMLIISGSIILLLIGVVGYLLKLKESSTKKEFSELLKIRENSTGREISKIGEVVKTMQSTGKEQAKIVEQLGKVVEVMKTNQESFKEMFSEKFATCENRLNSHSEDIHELKEKVVEINTRCKVKNHKELHS